MNKIIAFEALYNYKFNILRNKYTVLDLLPKIIVDNKYYYIRRSLSDEDFDINQFDKKDRLIIEIFILFSVFPNSKLVDIKNNKLIIKQNKDIQSLEFVYEHEKIYTDKIKTMKPEYIYINNKKCKSYIKIERNLIDEFLHIEL